jgi:hypothetical protein
MSTPLHNIMRAAPAVFRIWWSGTRHLHDVVTVTAGYFYDTFAYEICLYGIYFYGIYIYGIYFYRALKILSNDCTVLRNT